MRESSIRLTFTGADREKGDNGTDQTKTKPHRNFFGFIF